MYSHVFTLKNQKLIRLFIRALAPALRPEDRKLLDVALAVVGELHEEHDHGPLLLDGAQEVPA